MTAGCCGNWSHSSCCCALPKAHAESNLLSSCCCLTNQQKLSVVFTSVQRDSGYWPREWIALWILTFPIWYYFWHVCSSSSSGGLTLSRIITWIVNSHMKRGEMFLILHFHLRILSSFQCHLLSQIIWFSFLCLNRSQSSTPWALCEIYLLHQHILCNCFHSCIHVIPNTLLFPL